MSSLDVKDARSMTNRHANQALTGLFEIKETRHFQRCLSSLAGFPLGPPDAGRSARRAISKLKGLTLIS